MRYIGCCSNCLGKDLTSCEKTGKIAVDQQRRIRDLPLVMDSYHLHPVDYARVDPTTTTPLRPSSVILYQHSSYSARVARKRLEQGKRDQS
jgi:hypothetical protein